MKSELFGSSTVGSILLFLIDAYLDNSSTNFFVFILSTPSLCCGEELIDIILLYFDVIFVRNTILMFCMLCLD